MLEKCSTRLGHRLLLVSPSPFCRQLVITAMFSCCSRKVRAQERQAAVWQPYDLHGSNLAGETELIMVTQHTDYSDHWAGRFRVWASVNGQLTAAREVNHGRRVQKSDEISLGKFSGVPSKLWIKLVDAGDNYKFDHIWAVQGGKRTLFWESRVTLGGMSRGQPVPDLVAVIPGSGDINSGGSRDSWEYTTPPIATTTPAPTTTTSATITPTTTTATPAPITYEDRCGVGEVKELRAADYRFLQQQDGNIALYQGQHVKWVSNTGGRTDSPYKLLLQPDGNLVSYDKNNSAIWQSGSRGNNCQLVLQKDGNVVIYGDDKHAKWDTGSR